MADLFSGITISGGTTGGGTGPVGPAGPKGNQGPPGSQGEDGNDGEVIFSLIDKTFPFPSVHTQLTGRTAATTLVTSPVGPVDASFYVSANINITTATNYSFSCLATYTDENNNPQTSTLEFNFTDASPVTFFSNASGLGVGAYEGVVKHIRCKSGTTISIATVGTFTSIIYDTDGLIIQTDKVSLNGLQGNQGVQGIQGIQGKQGFGFDGDQGEDGSQGPPGIQGNQGPVGNTGLTGPPGPIGIGLPGVDGEDGSDSLVPGPQGSTGPQGSQGSTGPTGPQGTAGVSHAAVDGEDGIDGFPGMPGVAGATGPTGLTGPTGPAGVSHAAVDGEDGLDGFPGPAGPQGPTGAGTTGAQGPVGPFYMGADGDDGPDGMVGARGLTGLTGNPGPPVPGEDGVDGDSYYDRTSGSLYRSNLGPDAKNWVFLGTLSGTGVTVGPLIWTGQYQQIYFEYLIGGYSGGTPVGRIQFGSAAISTTALNNGNGLQEGATANATSVSVPGCPLAVTLSSVARQGRGWISGASGSLKQIDIKGKSGNPAAATSPTVFSASSFFTDLGTNLLIQRLQLTVYDTLIAVAVSANTFIATTALWAWGRNND